VGTYIAGRLLSSIPVLLLLSLVVFLFVRLVPGSPGEAILGQHATPALVAQVNQSLGLDRPLPEQYLDFLLRLCRGDFGHSFLTGRAVASDFAERFPRTLELSLAALTIAVGVGVPLGRAAALRRGTWLDALVTVISVGSISIPIFVLGFGLVFVFAVQLHWLPAGGQLDPRLGIPAITHFAVIDALLAGRLDGVADALRHLVLPAVTLASYPFAGITRMTRTAVLEVAADDYVRTARAKGLPEAVVRSRHIMRNAWLPVLTLGGLYVGGLLAGAVITEAVFTWNGVGSLIVDAIKNHDYIVLQSSIFLVGVIFLVSNLLVDISYAVVDPRIRVR
jgi:peptide/nickel transport system permease protein